MLENSNGRNVVIVTLVIVSISAIAIFYLTTGINDWGLIIRREEKAEFELSNLTISPKTVHPGERVDVGLDVCNIGDLQGTHTVKLEINGKVKDSQAVTLDPGEESKITFSIMRSTAGEYDIKIGNLTNSFRIRKPEPVTGHYETTYEWEYKDSKYSISLKIPKSLHKFYKNLERPSDPKDYSILVSSQKDDEYIGNLAKKLEEMAKRRNLKRFEKIDFIISFVQELPYTADNVTTKFDEYPRYPIETLVDGGGDCEDTSILICSILRELGYEIRLISFPEHMAVGILGEGLSGTYYEFNGKKYYYLETTGGGWEIGEIPPEYEGYNPTLIELAPKPVIKTNWDATLREEAKLEIDVKNIGTAPLDNAYVFAGFDAGENFLWNAEKSSSFNCPPNQEVNLEMIIKVPERENTRLVVQIVDNEYAINTSYSEWFET